MKYTNNFNLPDPIFKALSFSDYDKGEADISVTELIGPARKAALVRQYKDELTSDASSFFSSVIGSAFHDRVENQVTTGIKEERFYTDILGVKVGGKIDWYNDGVLYDWKVKKTFGFMLGSDREDFMKQLNCYAEIMRRNGYPIRQLRFFAVIVDWMRGKVQSDSRYPKNAWLDEEVPLWSPEKCSNFLEERVKEHLKARKELPLCTDDERWCRDKVWAVTKVGNSTSYRNKSTKEEAEELLAKMGSDYFIQFRPGTNGRCEHHCSASQFCTQYQQLKEKQNAI